MRAARLLIGLLLVGGLVGALITGRQPYSRLFFVAILLVVLSVVWTWALTRRLRLRRWTRSLRANVGDILEEHYEVHNNSILGALWIEALNETTIPGAAGSRLLTLMGPRHKRTYTARTWLTRRGAFPLGPTQLSSGDLFGLFRFKKVFPAQDSLIVLPMIFNLASFASPPGILSGGPVIQRRANDITPYASGVREYIHGDPMKRIHWPTTVRRGQMMVKEFQQDPQAEVWLFLDAQDTVHYEVKGRMQKHTTDVMMLKVDAFLFSKRPDFHLPPSSLEYSISIAASLAHYFIGQNRAVGMVTSGRTYTAIPAERTERQETKILETLAFVEARSSLSISGLVAAQARQLAKGSSAILITPTVSPELLVAVDDLLRRSIRPIVVLLGSQSFGGPPGTDKLMQTLQARKIPVCPIYCDADLGPTLASFASNSITQDAKVWKRPPLPHLT